MQHSRPIISPDIIGQPEDDAKRQFQSTGDMSALRNKYNNSKNTAGTSSKEERERAVDGESGSNQVNGQSLLKFCSGYSIEDPTLTNDELVKSQKSLTVQKDKGLNNQ